MPALSAAHVLSVWELGARRHPLDRALLLFAVADPARAPESLADVPLGACNAALMRLRQQCFGDALPAWGDCPSCGERMSFELDASQLPAMTPPAEGVEVDGYHFRCPSTRLLSSAVDRSTDPAQIARHLLQACATDGRALPADDAALDTLLEHASAALDAADPWAGLSLDYCCPHCGHVGDIALDIASYLWEEIDARARHLLDDVHLLARAYGWREDDILALSEARRAAYLARVAP